MSQSKPVILVAIPCYNEAKFIGDLVSISLKYANRVVVIDDASTDQTAQIAEHAGATVIRHPRQMGAGAAARSCFAAAREMGCDVLVTMDGDAQHDPDEIPLLVQPVIEKGMDLVIGSRFLKPYRIKSYRKIGIDILTWIFNLGRRQKLTDAQCCFRAHSSRLVNLVNITDDGFGFSIEVLAWADRQGLQITEVPVSCIYHSEGSTIDPLTHGIEVAWSVLRHRIKSI